MRPVKCVNEHFFDADKYAKCPQCGAEMKTINSSSFSKYENKPAKTSLFGRGRKKKESDVVMVPMSSEQGTFGFFTPGSPASENDEVDASQSMMISQGDEDSLESSNQMEPTVSDNLMEDYENNRETVNESQKEYVQMQPQVTVVKQPSVTASVADEIRRVSSNNNGKTVGFFSQNRRQRTETSDKPFATNTEPVVGWLICVRGPHFGESFSITSGRNSIGRNSTNSVCLSKDDTVSREKHAWLVFEPRKKRFVAQPGEASGLAYVNGEEVLQPVELHEKEVIEFGNTKLMLIPLCGENFSWEEWMEDSDS